jgi:hypothetical protein
MHGVLTGMTGSTKLTGQFLDEMFISYGCDADMSCGGYLGLWILNAAGTQADVTYVEGG